MCDLTLKNPFSQGLIQQESSLLYTHQKVAYLNTIWLKNDEMECL